MAVSKKLAREHIRAKFMEAVAKYLTDSGEEVLITGSNEISIPCVDETGEDEWLVLTFKVPTGSRDGEPYDGYSMAEDYQIHLRNKEETAKAAAEAKAKKIARDKAAREAKAKAREEAKKATAAK